VGVILDVVYRSEWDDGFGARGWKLTSTISDQRVIATTAFIGEVSDTSVFVHDIVDHHLCGLGIGGHRNEAIAVFLHALRSNVPIESSITMMVEDLMKSGECGERLETFLPREMLVITDYDIVPRKRFMHSIIQQYGERDIYERLVEHYYMIGASGVRAGLNAWASHGLLNAQRTAIGRCLQTLIEQMDTHMLDLEQTTAEARVYIENHICCASINGRQFDVSVIS